MKKLIILLLFSSFAFGQTGSIMPYPIEGFQISSGDVWISNSEPSERITKIETIKDSLYVYKTITPGYSNISCAVYHGDGVCSWNSPHDVREVYALMDGEMKLVKTQTPKYRKVEKVVEEVEKYWD